MRDWLSKVFAFDVAGVNWPRGVMVLDVMLVPLVVFWAIGHEQYLLSAVFGVLVAVVLDPGGSYAQRVSQIAGFGVIGAGVTALGTALGGTAWGWLVLVAFVVTLVAGLSVMFGVYRFVGAVFLNVWFLIALGLAVSLHGRHGISNHTWAQVAAWVGGTALWIAWTFIEWLIRGRPDLPQPIAEIPGDRSRRKLTRPIVMFAVIRALAIAGCVALAFGLNLSHGIWIPIAAIVAIKPSYEQTKLMGAQRVAGALIGAAAAMLLLLIPANETGLRLFAIDRGLEMVAIVLLMHAVATRVANYAVYYGFITAAVLSCSTFPSRRTSPPKANGWPGRWSASESGWPPCSSPICSANAPPNRHPSTHRQLPRSRPLPHHNGRSVRAVPARTLDYGPSARPEIRGMWVMTGEE
jgi:hypothetical protein